MGDGAQGEEILPEVFKKNKEVSKVMEDYVNFYYLLRKLDKSTYKAREEYRKNIKHIINFVNHNKKSADEINHPRHILLNLGNTHPIAFL